MFMYWKTPYKKFKVLKYIDALMEILDISHTWLWSSNINNLKLKTKYIPVKQYYHTIIKLCAIEYDIDI